MYSSGKEENDSPNPPSGGQAVMQAWMTITNPEQLKQFQKDFEEAPQPVKDEILAEMTAELCKYETMITILPAKEAKPTLERSKRRRNRL